MSLHSLYCDRSWASSAGSSGETRDVHMATVLLAIKTNRGLKMECDECQHLSGLFLESMIDADKAETALRAYFLTHQHGASVSELAEYWSLKKEQQRTVDWRDSALIQIC